MLSLKPGCIKDFVMWEANKMLGGGWNSSSPSQGHGAELLLGASAPVPAEVSPAWWPRVCGRWLGPTRS